MENQKITIDKCKFNVSFLINGVENIEKMLQKFQTLLHAEKNLLQALISETEYEIFLSECFKSKKYEPEIIQKANQIIENLSKEDFNN